MLPASYLSPVGPGVGAKLVERLEPTLVGSTGALNWWGPPECKRDRCIQESKGSNEQCQWLPCHGQLCSAAAQEPYHLLGATQRGEEQPSWSTWLSSPFYLWTSSLHLELPKAKACPEPSRLWESSSLPAACPHPGRQQPQQAIAALLPGRCCQPSCISSQVLLCTFMQARYPLRAQNCRANLCC